MRSRKLAKENYSFSAIWLLGFFSLVFFQTKRKKYKIVEKFESCNLTADFSFYFFNFSTERSIRRVRLEKWNISVAKFFARLRNLEWRIFRSLKVITQCWRILRCGGCCRCWCRWSGLRLLHTSLHSIIHQHMGSKEAWNLREGFFRELASLLRERRLRCSQPDEGIARNINETRITYACATHSNELNM